MTGPLSFFRLLRRAVLWGGICGLAFPPVHWWIFAVIGISGWFKDQSRFSFSSLFQYWMSGWVFGTCYFLSHLWWIGIGVSTAGFPLLAVPTSLFFCLGLGLFWAIPSLLSGITRRFLKHPSDSLILLIWVGLFEYLRGYILTGFPWNPIGAIWNLQILQITHWTGIEGLSLLTLIGSVCVRTIWGRNTIFWYSTFLALYGIGWWNLTVPSLHEEYTIRIVQPNIAQGDKWNKSTFKRHVSCLLGLSYVPAERPLNVIVWPESAIATSLNLRSDLIQQIQDCCPGLGLIITGSLRFDATRHKIYNSLYVISQTGIESIYDKNHLVPFGEYIPLKSLNPMKKLTHGLMDYSPGEICGLTITPPNHYSFSPLICYEVIFPNCVINANSPPKWMVQITNDAWYKNSPGPYQHLHLARIRCIEEGIPLIRAANSGISAFIDSYGRIESQLPLGEQGYIDGLLPVARPPCTWAYSLRKHFFWILFGLLGCVLIRKIRSRQD